MSCLGPLYIPVPPREWSRVQNQCSTSVAAATSASASASAAAMLAKGNVLQYKKNSANLTKHQRYSKIATGSWTNRNTTWATQSYIYTNPNTTSLKRVGAINILVNPINNTFVPTTLPITCNGSGSGSSSYVIADGGTLLCNVQENACTGQIISAQPAAAATCNPTSDSDVPGPVQYLCWQSGTQTWYPKTRTTMNNSGDKWPIGSKFIFPAR